MKKHGYITTRNHVAVAAHMRRGGSMGGTAKSNNRRDRKRAKRELRNEHR